MTTFDSLIFFVIVVVGPLLALTAVAIAAAYPIAVTVGAIAAVRRRYGIRAALPFGLALIVGWIAVPVVTLAVSLPLMLVLRKFWRPAVELPQAQVV
jgi:hypothetical protein